MLLQALHVEIQMKNLNLQITLLVQKGVGTPFPPYSTPGFIRQIGFISYLGVCSYFR